MKLTSVPPPRANTQIFTPQALAEFMAELLVDRPEIRLLDPGSGPGTLTEAVISRANALGTSIDSITLVEQDPLLALDASSTMRDVVGHQVEVVCADFIEWALHEISQDHHFTHVILNPPYAKLRRDSPASRMLLNNGITVPNIYAAFLWLSLVLLSPGGILVAVIPRSFLSGNTFAPLRRYFAQHATLTAVHHFKSRRAVFSRDGILQEVVVVRFERGTRDKEVHVSSSVGLDDLDESSPFSVSQSRLRGATSSDVSILIPSSRVPSVPNDAPLVISEDLRVQTGSVVDFRTAEYIVQDAHDNTVPLIGSEAFRSRSSTEITCDDVQRHLVLTPQTRGHVRTGGTFVISRRISPRERQPRLDVRIVDASNFPLGVAFENHVNVISSAREGLTRSGGLKILDLLTQENIDQQLDERLSSTQVNAADLRQLRYIPSEDSEDTK